MKLNLLSIMLLGSGLFLTACGGSDDKGDNSSTSSNVDVNNIQNPVVNTPVPYEYTEDYPPNAEASVVMTYKMKGITGQETQATALVFTPKTAPPAGGWPIVAWAHGTVGVNDDCAPSENYLIMEGGRTPDLHTHKMIDSLVKDGYVVVAPNYEGLGEPKAPGEETIDKEMHPYLNLKSAAYSVTDAVVATKSWLGNKASNKWAVAGHSQGGHAALGAAQYAARANMDYKGAIAIAPASNLELIEKLMEMALADRTGITQVGGYALLDTFTAYMAAGIKATNPTEPVYSIVFKSPTDEIAKKVEEKDQCLQAMALEFTLPMISYRANNKGSLVGYPRKNEGYANNPLVRKFLDKDSAPLQTVIKTPIIIYQGDKDITVLPQATNALVAQARAMTTKIDYRTNSSWDHTDAFKANVENGQLMEDIKTLLAN
ncbi:alpha/beta hydrolase family protein [Acinetobacter guillouiae]|uniref:alpha/beta hydrolase family protein n=1 Tax=Acinetobacter guillouiae TaxID=106649 RepID=UPI0026E21048|nr:lipase family protein [Acinetobacter guillouiae]MDO6643093.1 lipase family protein [Acinetobacter guillouiae]